MTTTLSECPDCKTTFKSRQSLTYHIDKKVCHRHKCFNCNIGHKNKHGLTKHLAEKKCMGPKIHTVIRLKPATPKQLIPYQDLTPEMIKEDFGELIVEITDKPPVSIIPEFIELVLCNKKFRHYWTIFISNKHDRTVNIYQGVWNIVPSKRVLRELVSWALDLLTSFIMTYPDMFTAAQIEKFSKFRSTLLDPSRAILLDDTIGEIFCKLFNHRLMINPPAPRRIRRKTSKPVSDQTQAESELEVEVEVEPEQVQVQVQVELEPNDA